MMIQGSLTEGDQFRSAPFYIENITASFTKQATLMRRSTVLSLPTLVGIPWMILKSVF
jgi:hypothetical protein